MLCGQKPKVWRFIRIRLNSVMIEEKIMFRSWLGIISTVTISAWFGFALWATYFVFDNNTQIYAEKGLIENIQACLLAIACIVYLATVALEKRSEKLILLSCSLLCYSFVLRELDVEKYDIPYALKIIGSGVGRNTTVATAFAAIFVYAALSNYFYYKKAAVGFIGTRPGILLMTGGVFLFIGDFFEGYKAITHHTFIEEMAELFAYVLIVLSSLAANSFISSTTNRSSVHGKARR